MCRAEHLLAGSVLSQHQHGQIGLGNLGSGLPNRFDLRILADQMRGSGRIIDQSISGLGQMPSRAVGLDRHGGVSSEIGQDLGIGICQTPRRDD